MKSFIFVVAAICISVSAQADQKAVDEAKCEAKCQEVAAHKFAECKEVNECREFVVDQFNSCMHSCDKE